jgi:hypothetical protein
MAKKPPPNVPLGRLKRRLKTTYMPRHTASYDPLNMTCKNINQNMRLKAPASRPLISCISALNPTHSAALLPNRLARDYIRGIRRFRPNKCISRPYPTNAACLLCAKGCRLRDDSTSAKAVIGSTTVMSIVWLRVGGNRTIRIWPRRSGKRALAK